jgi:hypothetical protein
LFTLTVLVGTVVFIYVTFPARHHELLTRGVELHKHPPAWDLPSPTAREVHALAIGVGGTDVPLPAGDVIGAERIEVLNREAAVLRYRVGPDEVTYVVQHARGIAPARYERRDGDLRAVEWRRGTFACVAIGRDATSASWLPLFH